MKVHDQVFSNNKLTEDTLDYYAQDKPRTVWHLGEDTKELDENGNVVSTEGTWQSGVNGGKPGIIMEAQPQGGGHLQAGRRQGGPGLRHGP